MINIKETCRTCPKLDHCIKTVEHNINNIWILVKKQRINCVNFEHFESVVENHVMDVLQDALMSFKGEIL